MNIRAKIDVTKISKSRLFVGKQGTYLNITLIESSNEFSDGFIVEEVSKEERDKGIKGTILGNFSYIKPKAEPVNQAVPIQPTSNGDIPF